MRTRNAQLQLSPISVTFHDCPEATNAIILIEVLTRALVTIPKGPPGFRNVMPPIGGGPFAAGMDPAGITDPKARAAYEAAISENKLRIEESNARQRVELAIRELETALYSTLREVQANKAASPLRDFIRASSMPEVNKRRILGVE